MSGESGIEKSILLFGGSFDPIHNGHLIVARAVAEKLGVEKVVLIPSANPPHKQKMLLASASDRLAMAQLAAAGDKLFEVSDCELCRQGPSYTLDTVRYFRKVYAPDVTLYWLIGADTVRELPTWYEVGQLADLCVIVTARRPGFDQENLTCLSKVLTSGQIDLLQRYILDTPLIDISATEIRRKIRESQPIFEHVPERVAEYLYRKNLYQGQKL